MQSIFSIAPVDITPVGLTDTISLTTFLPAGADGAIFYVVNSGAVYANINIRRTGQSFSSGPLGPNAHTWAMSGLGGLKSIVVYRENTDVSFYLIGYTLPLGVTWLSLPVSLGFGVNNWSLESYPDVIPGAKAVILRFSNADTDFCRVGFRKLGSTDNITHGSKGESIFTIVVPCTDHQEFEIYSSRPDVSFDIIGYITTGIQAYTNSIEVTPGAIGAWTDLSNIPVNSHMAFIEMVSNVADPSTALPKLCGVREEGSVDVPYHNIENHALAIVPTANGIGVEGIIEDNTVAMYIRGFAEGPAPAGEKSPFGAILS